MMSEQQSLDRQIKHQKEYRFLRPADRVKSGLFGKEIFDLRFDQIRGTMVDGGFLNAAFSFLSYKCKHPETKHNEPTTKEELAQLQIQLPMVVPNFEIPPAKTIKYTWIGHSTAVIQVGEDNLLIDPVFSQRSSPYQFAGPKRFRPPACEISQLPKIDMVLVSHDHYDHLDEHSLNELQTRYKPVFVAGIGSRSVFPENSDTREMDWMQQITVSIKSKEYKIIFVPVCHWSRRGLNDYNTRLWGGFVVITPTGQRLFYSGDTGYCDVFKEIGDKFGPFDLSILPIGAYQPRELLQAQHVNPDEAVKIHLELRSKQSFGVHWGTFPLGMQRFYQAKYDLETAKQAHELKKQEFLAIKHGESILLPL